jgi:NitT/TauT family transport system ATP-binding protein
MAVQFENTALPDIIELKNILQEYDDPKKNEKQVVIKDLNLLIEDKPDQGQFVVILGKSGCVDADTEFFNGKKWKRIANWVMGEKILQYNSDGHANLVEPERYVVLHADYLNLIQSKYGVDQCFCDEHTMVFRGRRKDRPSNLHTISGIEFVKRQKGTSRGFQNGFITTFKYAGKGILLSDAEIRVMVAVIADGHFRSGTNLCVIRIKKIRKIKRLRLLLTNAGIVFKEKEQTKGFLNFIFNAPRREKLYTDFWYDCTHDQLDIITQESLLWDGSTVNDRDYVSTTIKETADFLQFAFTACGIRSTININDRRGKTQGKYVRKSIEYKVLCSQNDLVGVSGDNPVKVKKYKTVDGKKYCFTVPSGMLVLRRNNKIFITGNCGKSTLLRYVAGLQKPTSGEILIHGKPRTKETKIGMVFQKYSSQPWLKVIDCVEFGLMLGGMPKKERREKAMAMIEIVGLTGQENKYSQELSGGQQQRVAIARSLLCNPSILLMDEPFGALDASTRLKMQDLLADLWRKALKDMTVIFVTHDIPEAVYLGDEIWIMSANPGQIVDRIHIDIPITRAKEMKRDPKFTNYVYTIEDKLNSL